MVPAMDEPIRTLFIEMIRAGVIDPDIVDQAADEREAVGDEEGAHALRCLTLAAMTTSQVDLAKSRKRRGFKVLDGGNGAD